MIIIGILSIITGFFKGIADIVQHKDLWKQSIFSKYDIESFFGSKDMTWKRKYNYRFKLMQTVFVAFTDIWHFANMIYWKICPLIIIFYSLITLNTLLWAAINTCIYIGATTLSFHVSYHKILKKKNV